MSSATSTKGAASRTHYAPGTTIEDPEADQGLRPWQFFVLAGLACATAITWMARAQGFTAVLVTHDVAEREDAARQLNLQTAKYRCVRNK